MFRIGEFSRLSRVSVRMLRHYDQLVCSTIAYRLIHEIPPLLSGSAAAPESKRALRDLGFSLEQIGPARGGIPAGQLLGMLKLKRAELEQQMQDEQLRMARWRRRINQRMANCFQ